MRLLLSPTQMVHMEKGKRLFFSPEAIALRDDPILGGETQKAAALDHFFEGWRHLKPRLNDKGEKLPGFSLGLDDSINIDPIEAKMHEIAETKKYIKEGEKTNSFSSLNKNEIEWLESAARELLAPGVIDKIGELGTTNRLYPINYKDKELRGKPIPAKFAPGQKRDRGMSLLSNKFQNIDVDTGVGLYGSNVDALHRNAAANNPNLLTAIDNIRFGGSSINQSVKSFEGDQLKKSLLSRLLRLNDELFMIENGVKAAPPDKGSITKKEGIQFNKLLKNIQHERDKWAGDVFTGMARINSPGDTINSPVTTVTMPI